MNIMKLHILIDEFLCKIDASLYNFFSFFVSKISFFVNYLFSATQK